ncbi:MAG: Fe(3+) ABC transporter substrate-binding protein [Verrucomicrobiota bacterium]
MLHSLLLCLLSLVGLNAAEEVNVYSHRHYAADQKLFAQFENETGIKVNVIKASADQLIERLKQEGKNSPADVLITVDAGRLHRAQEGKLLQPISSTVLMENVPEAFRDTEGHWFGLAIRSRVLIYAKDRVKPSDLSTYEDLADPKWKNRILARSSTNIYNQSLMASIIAAHGEAKAKEWAAAVLSNLARDPRGSDRDQMRGVAQGLADVAIANTYYLGLLEYTSEPKDVKAAKKLGVFFPNQGDRGAHVNVSAAGVTASSKNKANAIKLIEFLSSDEAQKVFAEANYEFPLKASNNQSAYLKSWGDFKKDAVDLSRLGELNGAAVKVFDQVGWK